MSSVVFAKFPFFIVPCIFSVEAAPKVLVRGRCTYETLTSRIKHWLYILSRPGALRTHNALVVGRQREEGAISYWYQYNLDEAHSLKVTMRLAFMEISAVFSSIKYFWKSVWSF